jgi:hypothetical protein
MGESAFEERLKFDPDTQNALLEFLRQCPLDAEHGLGPVVGLEITYTGGRKSLTFSRRQEAEAELFILSFEHDETVMSAKILYSDLTDAALYRLLYGVSESQQRVLGLDVAYDTN